MHAVKAETLKRNAARLLNCARRIATGAVSANKEEFHRLGRAVLRGVLGHLGFDSEVRSCRGGPAVCGEVVLHTAEVYVQLGVPTFGGGLRFLYRTVEGRNDYCGGPNRWFAFERLAADPMEFVEALNDLTSPAHPR
jgi:hypothetical protein